MLEVKMSDFILVVEVVKAGQWQEQVNKKGQDFKLTVTKLQGIAKITDLTTFADNLVKGYGVKKRLGFGTLTFSPFAWL
jgi:hypothetical protein